MILYRIRKRKRVENDDELIKIGLLEKYPLPQKSAIYLFGGLRLYNKEGEEISKKMSPTLKELLSILIIHSDKNGISSAKLKELLWFHMNVDSARNNRAVYLRKLRILFEEIGTITVLNDNSCWKIDCGDVFVDYLFYKETLSLSDISAKQKVERLIAIVNQGGILSDSDQVWVDSIKGDVTNEIIEILLLFAESDSANVNPGTCLMISEAISNLERLNEDSLRLRCRAYALSGRYQSAKSTYDRFCAEYKSVYDQDYQISFTDIVN